MHCKREMNVSQIFSRAPLIHGSSTKQGRLCSLIIYHIIYHRPRTPYSQLFLPLVTLSSPSCWTLALVKDKTVLKTLRVLIVLAKLTRASNLRCAATRRAKHISRELLANKGCRWHSWELEEEMENGQKMPGFQWQAKKAYLKVLSAYLNITIPKLLRVVVNCLVANMIFLEVNAASWIKCWISQLK